MRRQNKFFSLVALAVLAIAPLSVRGENIDNFTPAQSMANLSKSADKIVSLMDKINRRYPIIQFSFYGEYQTRPNWYDALQEVFLALPGPSGGQEIWLLKSPINFGTTARRVVGLLQGSAQPSRPLYALRGAERGYDERRNPDANAQALQQGFAMLQDTYIHMLPSVFLTIERVRQIYFYLDPENGNRPQRPLTAEDKSELADTLLDLFETSHNVMGWMQYMRSDDTLGAFFDEADWEGTYGRVYAFGQDPREQEQLDYQFRSATSPQATEYLMPLFRNAGVAKRVRYNTYRDGSLIPSDPRTNRNYVTGSPQASEQLDISKIPPRIYASPQQPSPQSPSVTPRAPSKLMRPSPQSPGKYVPGGDTVGPAPLDPSTLNQGTNASSLDLNDPSVNAFLQKCFDKREDINQPEQFRREIGDMLARLGIDKRPPIISPPSPGFVPSRPAAPAPAAAPMPDSNPDLTAPIVPTPPAPNVPPPPAAGPETPPVPDVNPAPAEVIPPLIKPGGKPASFPRPVRRLNLVKPAPTNKRAN